MENRIDLKCLRQLLDMNFFIPNYQRGYRWTTRQVKELLIDLSHFAMLNGKQDCEFYCMQPLVVRHMSEADIEAKKLNHNGKPWYEVIDGQQRLTTLLLLLWELRNDIARNKPKHRYQLSYARHTDTSDKFLEGVNAIDESSIDSYHLSQALLFIRDWLGLNESLEFSKFTDTLLSHQPAVEPGSEPIDKANNVRFIWYEITEEDAIDVFTRLNIGKISLTNAELIKALLLNRSNFADDAHLRLRQQEIASEWDRIESTLREETFWYFLNDAESRMPTRIDMIFDLIRECNEFDLEDEALKEAGNDQYSTFRYFYCYFTSSKCDIEACWTLVKLYFQAFKDWYYDVDMYHYIGYVLYQKKSSVKALMESWRKAESKAEFTAILKSLTYECIKGIDPDRQYGEDGSGKEKCRPLLLFHNIQTSIDSNFDAHRNHDGFFYRFPFNLFKKEKWDVEHINSNTTNPETDESTRREWLVNVYLSASHDGRKLIEEYFAGVGEPRKDEIFKEVRKEFKSADGGWTQEEKNRIWNYTLLDSSTNRSYGNAIFSGKRRVIAGKETGKAIAIPTLKGNTFSIAEETESESRFVPPCTKNVFMKYYSSVADNNNYWTKEIDAPAYKKDIEDCIEKVTPQNND